MAKEKLELEELRKKGLNHLAELLEAKVEDEEDEPEFDDEGEEKSKLEKSDKKEVKESAFDKAVEGLALEESDVQKMKDVFNTAVEERAKELSESALASLDAKIKKTLQEQEEKQDKHISNYLDFVVEGWVKDNAIEIEKQVKVDLAESFLGKLKALFEEHDMILESDEKIDQIQEAQSEVDLAKQELNEALEALAETKQTLFAIQVKGVITELSEGMTEMQKERFKTICEDVEVEVKEGVESVKARLLNLKDVFVNDSTTITESVEKTAELVIEEEVKEVEVKEEKIDESEKVEIDPKMASYVSAIKRSFSALNR